MRATSLPESLATWCLDRPPARAFEPGHFALTCELHRVAYEIDQNLTQPKRIAPQPIRNAAVDGERNVQTLLRGSHAESLHRVGDQLANGEVHRLQLEAARFDLGEVEDV